MINWDKCLGALHWIMAMIVKILEGGINIMFDLVVSVLVIVAIVELIKYLKRH